MFRHLLIMGSFASFGICITYAQNFYFAGTGLHTASLILGGISFILLLLGNWAIAHNDQSSYKEGYQACENDSKEFERLLREQKERED